MAVYHSVGIDPVEHTAWIGPSVLVFSALGAVRMRMRAEVRAVMVIAVVFLAWSLGAYLMAFGRRTSMLLPAVLIRFVPLVSNARIPARAFVVVYMALAVLSAGRITALARSTNLRSRTVALLLAALLAADYAPATPPTFAPGNATLYSAIDRNGAAGAVLELPLGLRDGFGEIGRFDSRMLYYQSFHERPILGGFVARLPPSVVTSYRKMPIVGSLLQLSEGAVLSAEQFQADRAQAADTLASLNVRSVVVNLETASPPLLKYVNTVLPLRAVATDEQRVLYEMTRNAR